MTGASGGRQGLKIGIGSGGQLVQIVGGAKLSQVAQHIVYAPSIRKVLANGGEYPAVSIVRFPAGVDVVHELAVIVERTVGEVSMLSQILDGRGVPGPAACPAGIFPLRFRRIVIGPALVSQALGSRVLLPLLHFRGYLVHASDARRKKFRIAAAQLLATRIEQVGLVSQSFVFADPKPLRKGDLNRLSVLERLVPHEEGSRRTPDEAEPVLINPLVSCKTSFA